MEMKRCFIISVNGECGRQYWKAELIFFFFFLSCKCIKVICEVVNAKNVLRSFIFVKNLYKNPSDLEQAEDYLVYL